eukprot:CAMPEP_0195518462 /NCGR_PEP_ID=MMETSP0794_2-20130614/12944_1 /TAXON_ID=515487 /ORGANISM="Stephanopyxis turris, Strain CCMP 815" /LENGTH=775 /DNA_ID=CAMNT_0040647431 /DNA_START=104 /DNA_END=2431 /DNA_ORIENTATION=+
MVTSHTTATASKKGRTILASLLLLGGSLADAELVATLGTGAAVTGGVATTLTYGDGGLLELAIETDADATVTLSAEASLAYDIPANYSSIAFDAGVGFSLDVSGNANITSATLTTGALSASVLATLSGGDEARCLYYDVSVGAYASVPVQEVTLLDQLVIELPDVGLYTFATASVSVPIPHVVTLGASVDVDAEAGATIQFADAPGLELAVRTDADAQVTVSAVAQVKTAPAGYSSSSLDTGLGVDIGFEVDVSGGASITEATLTTPPLSVSALASLTGSVEARGLRFDASADAYAGVPAALDETSGSIVLDVPDVGVYFVASADVIVPLPTLYLQARATTSASASFSYPLGFALDVATETENEVTVAWSATSTHSDPENATSTGVYFSIDLDDESSDEVEAMLMYQYNQTSEVSNDAAMNLQFAFWDTTESSWQFLSSGAYVDLDAKVVAQATSHFSEWGVFDNDDSSSAVSSESTLGVGVAVEGSAYSRITYSDAPGLELLIKTDQACDVTLSAEANVGAGLTEGYDAFTLGANAGYELFLSGGASVVDAELTTPALSASVMALITGSVDARVVRFDATAEAYTGVEVKSMTLSNKLVVDLPTVGTYYFATVDQSVPIPTLYAEARVTSSTSSSFSYKGGFVLDVATSSDNAVTVEFAESSQRSDPDNATSIGAFFDITLENEESVEATLHYEYDSSVDADAAASLRFAFWDEANAQWTFLSGAEVDVDARVVSQTTVHFSEWGVFGDDSFLSGATSVSLAASAVAAALVVLL